MPWMQAVPLLAGGWLVRDAGMDGDRNESDGRMGKWGEWTLSVWSSDGGRLDRECDGGQTAQKGAAEARCVCQGTPSEVVVTAMQDG